MQGHPAAGAVLGEPGFSPRGPPTPAEAGGSRRPGEVLPPVSRPSVRVGGSSDGKVFSQAGEKAHSAYLGVLFFGSRLKGNGNV